MKKEPFLLIDGNFLMFQSFYASYNPYNEQKLMHSPQGITTNGVHVFLMTLFKLIKEVKPQYLFIAFDAFGKTKRHEKFSEYKAGRIKAPEIIFEQFTLIKKILTKMNIKWFEQVGDEADDLIATLAQNKNTYNYIFSKDKDLLQLVNENTSILKVMKTSSYTTGFELINNTNFKNLMGIEPWQIPDFKGIAGDASDNLKGIPGIGTKGAIKLINEFHSLEEIYENIDSIKGKIKEKLINGKSEGFLCKELALLNRNVNMNLNINDYKININEKEGSKILEDYNLITVLKKFFIY
ncbi:5'-3' exonuclease [Mycoplasmopsis lipofaciens]|uniref:5'-3' exonuclease n=1 Tax=Mycoplasmopsis lipofaciens TaxID=114884 RepID=UPI000482B89C|nr:5'-3' exonuclease H3TH domain-containing protein [Mycoplasmopsis lipofaciens]